MNTPPGDPRQQRACRHACSFTSRAVSDCRGLLLGLGANRKDSLSVGTSRPPSGENIAHPTSSGRTLCCRKQPDILPDDATQFVLRTSASPGFAKRECRTTLLSRPSGPGPQEIAATLLPSFATRWRTPAALTLSARLFHTKNRPGQGPGRLLAIRLRALGGVPITPTQQHRTKRHEEEDE